MNISELREKIEAEIRSYIYEVPDGTLGAPMPMDWVSKQLAEFKLALVQPTWRSIKICDTVQQAQGKEKSELRNCVLVADDRHGYELYYDPTQDDFVLAYSGNPPSTFNVRGDAVGCFMSR